MDMEMRFAFRHEYKFLLHKGIYLQLREIMKKLMPKDSHFHNDEGYHIRSLYFDDLYDTAYHEKQLGFINREKFRIRIYNHSEKVIKLEIKQKRNDYIKKDSCSITRQEYNALLNGDVLFLYEDKDPVKQKFYHAFRNKMLKPRVIVDYLREAYILPFNKIRITFDKHLSALHPHQNIFDKSCTGQFIDGYYYILEVKYNNFLPGYIRDVLNMYSLNRLAVSKYVLCRQHLINQTGDKNFE